MYTRLVLVTVFTLFSLMSLAQEPKEKQAKATNPFKGAKLFVNEYNEPAQYVREKKGTKEEVRLMNRIAVGAETQWFGDWNADVGKDLENWVKAVEAQQALPCFVLYNIPLRDKGEYSEGGTKNPEGYRTWIKEIAKTIGKRKVVVLLEPDALAQLDRLTDEQKKDRTMLIKEAVIALKKCPSCYVYIDAGHPRWHASKTMIDRLLAAGIKHADGFCLNISNYCTDEQCIAYGKEISKEVGRKHFVIDRGRNGNGPDPNGETINPPSAALGKLPTTDTEEPLVDAFLWVRGPAGSDGEKHGGPKPGTFWPEGAFRLVRNAEKLEKK